MRFNLHIDEQERRRILHLHEQVKPGVTVTELEFPVQNLGDNFDYGKKDSDRAKQSIVNMKPEIEKFIKNSTSRNFVVTITAGESQVTNPKGYETKGSLAKARAEEVKKYFEEIFPEQIKNGTLSIKVEEPIIGTTPYKKGDQNDAEKMKLYKKEQFVRYQIKGVGQKRTVSNFCDTGKKEQRGASIPSSVDFTQTVNWVIGDGEGPFFLYSEAHTMPDIIYFEYNGKTYVKDKTAFRGGDFSWTRLLIGTALMAKYGGGGLPAQYGDTKYRKININEYMGALKELGGTSYGMEESFENIFGSGQEFDNPEYMEAFKEWDRTKNSKKVVKELGPNFPWGYLTSPILPPLQKNIPVIKVDGVNTIKVINVAPNGGTVWNCGTTCKEF